MKKIHAESNVANILISLGGPGSEQGKRKKKRESSSNGHVGGSNSHGMASSDSIKQEKRDRGTDSDSSDMVSETNSDQPITVQQIRRKISAAAAMDETFGDDANLEAFEEALDGKTSNDFEKQELIRRERNKLHARKTRVRKKILMTEMQDIISRLETDITTLKAKARKRSMSQGNNDLSGMDSLGIVLKAEGMSRAMSMDDTADYATLDSIKENDGEDPANVKTIKSSMGSTSRLDLYLENTLSTNETIDYHGNERLERHESLQILHTLKTNSADMTIQDTNAVSTGYDVDDNNSSGGSEDAREDTSVSIGLPPSGCASDLHELSNKKRNDSYSSDNSPRLTESGATSLASSSVIGSNKGSSSSRSEGSSGGQMSTSGSGSGSGGGSGGSEDDNDKETNSETNNEASENSDGNTSESSRTKRGNAMNLSKSRKSHSKGEDGATVAFLA